ncbi:MAG: eight-cysteine-cluster domain-containing protein [Patescibacteria group bacterium]|jgi:eight-cysteine-cluster-containing protein
MKKTFLLSAFIISLFILSSCTQKPIINNNQASNDVCAKEGEQTRLNDDFLPATCCGSLKPMYNIGYNGDCKASNPPGDIGVCSNCGNGVCDVKNKEDKCNCAIDCQDNKAEKITTNLNGFCGRSTKAKCQTDADCAATGCSGQICGLANNGEVSTCEWTDCYDQTKYGVSCGCVAEECQWYK